MPFTPVSIAYKPFSSGIFIYNGGELPTPTKNMFNCITYLLFSFSFFHPPMHMIPHFTLLHNSVPVENRCRAIFTVYWHHLQQDHFHCHYPAEKDSVFCFGLFSWAVKSPAD
jgi:hypothetical protein